MHFEKPAVICPHCDYELTPDDMNANEPDDLWALAKDENRCAVTCPSCDMEFWVQGGYRPHYTTAIEEEEL